MVSKLHHVEALRAAFFTRGLKLLALNKSLIVVVVVVGALFQLREGRFWDSTITLSEAGMSRYPITG